MVRPTSHQNRPVPVERPARATKPKDQEPEGTPTQEPDQAASTPGADSTGSAATSPAPADAASDPEASQTAEPAPMCRTCGLPEAAHTVDESDHTFKAKRKYVKTAASADVPVDVASSFAPVPEEEWDKTPVVTHDRSEAQKILDKAVKDLYDEWVKRGKPAPLKSPRNRHAVAPDMSASLRRMLRRAETLHGIKVSFAPKHFDAQGREIVVYTARDKDKAKPETADASAEKTDANSNTDSEKSEK